MLIQRALHRRPVFVRDEGSKFRPFARNFHDSLALIDGDVIHLLVLGFLEGIVSIKRTWIERLDGRRHRLMHLLHKPRRMCTCLVSSHQGLETHNGVKSTEIPHSSVGTTCNCLDSDSRGDQNLIHLHVEQPVDVTAICSLDDYGGRDHFIPEHLVVRPGLDSADDFLNDNSALAKLLGPQCLDSVECLSPQEHLGPSHLQPRNGAPALKVQRCKLLCRLGTSHAVGNVGRLSLALLLGMSALLTLLRRGHCSGNGNEIHVAVDIVDVALSRVPRMIL